MHEGFQIRAAATCARLADEVRAAAQLCAEAGLTTEARTLRDVAQHGLDVLSAACAADPPLSLDELAERCGAIFRALRQTSALLHDLGAAEAAVRTRLAAHAVGGLHRQALRDTQPLD